MAPEVAGFPVFTRSGPVAVLVQPDDPAGRAAFFCRPDGPAIVLGSTQPEDSLDRGRVEAAGYLTVRRRSGGGAVLVAPGRQVWLDLFVPSGDPLFEHDVARASHFVGDLWTEALAALGAAREELAVHSGPMATTRWSRTWCFSGLGPGEVTRAGRKLVGLSQRRSRAGAWFFTMARYGLDPAFDASLVNLTETERAELSADLEIGGAALDWPLPDVERELARLLAGC